MQLACTCSKKPVDCLLLVGWAGYKNVGLSLAWAQAIRLYYTSTLDRQTLYIMCTYVSTGIIVQNDIYILAAIWKQFIYSGIHIKSVYFHRLWDSMERYIFCSTLILNFLFNETQKLDSNILSPTARHWHGVRSIPRMRHSYSFACLTITLYIMNVLKIFTYVAILHFMSWIEFKNWLLLIISDFRFLLVISSYCGDCWNNSEVNISIQ